MLCTLLYTEAKVPYDFKFVAANVRGCGQTYTEDAFFTEEGSMLHTYKHVHAHTCSFITPPASILIVHTDKDTHTFVTMLHYTIISPSTFSPSSQCGCEPTQWHCHECLLHPTEYRRGTEGGCDLLHLLYSPHL